MQKKSLQKQTILFVGRFQPFHKGHLQTILSLAQKHSHIIIGIGSAQKGFSLENPFTVRERGEFINKALFPLIKNFSIAYIPDINDNDDWVKHIKKIVGNFDVTCSNNSLVIRLFKEAGAAVFKHSLIKPDLYKATLIREKIIRGEKWKHLVPETVSSYLEKTHAAERLKTLASKRPIKDLLKKLRITPNTLSLWKIAFTHKSYLHEHKKEKLQSNERLEFLGDAVLELVITDFLYQKYPEAEEGVMTTQRSALVRTENLGDIALKLHLGDYLTMSFGEEKSGGRTNLSILANTFEAFIGTLYLDQGFSVTKNFIHSHLLKKLPETLLVQDTKDYKTKLQEYLQEKYKELPLYELVKEEGEEHNKNFTFVIKFKSKKLGKGIGKSKQIAQQEAAKEAYKKLAKT